MDSRIGLEYIVDNADYTSKLAKALDCNNVTVKKQVFELLSALCVYNGEGYNRALQALEQYKESKCERYRLKFIVDELSKDENPVDYKTTLLAFVNCVIVSAPQVKDRNRITNEFIGLKLLPVLEHLRKHVNVRNRYPDLGVQLDVFQEQRENDESQLLDNPYGVDLNSHVDVFYAILRQVADTPQEIPFLSILQHLLRIDPKEAISDIIWDTAETLVHRATLLESRQDATRILRSPSVQSRLCCHGHRSIPDTVGGSRKQSLNVTTSANGFHGIPSPPPSQGPPPPPPPFPEISPCSTDSSGGVPMAPPVPPPFQQKHQPATAASEAESADLDAKLPQQETPVPKTKMKTINWNKIPNNKVIGRHNIWSVVARSHEHSPMADLDWSEMEGLFCQQSPPASHSNQSSPKLGRGDSNESCERKRKEPSEIVLLDGKRSLNVNIFLKQFRCSNEDIIQIIQEGGHDDIGAEKLRGLLKMLPELDELEILKAFDGDKRKLASAENFLLQLVQIPNYKLRIESMLLKEEFASNMSYLEPSINGMILTGEDLMANKNLHEVLYMVVCAGNFLNSGGYAGNAAGVKLSSLQKLTDIRANKPGMNLIHYVAAQVERKREDLLKFTSRMGSLEEATKTTVEQLQNEINALEARVKKIKKQVELPGTELEIKDQMKDFLKAAEQECATLQQDMRELETVRVRLADFFCEDAATFKIEECFKVFHTFCMKFKQAIVENQRRRVQEEQAAARRKQREDQLAAKRRQMTGEGIQHGTGDVMDMLLNEHAPLKRQFEKEMRSRRMGQNNSIISEDDAPSATASPILMRRRLGSCSGDGVSGREDCSPDVTPNGSLRRRRSRVPSEEDENMLMDFLRKEQEARERKSWGSLDRSWARKARGGSGKKRPDLLNSEFVNERERGNSPSPLAEHKSLLSTPVEEEVKPKAWRQKIEAWLQENEKEEKQNEELLSRSRRGRRIPETDRDSMGKNDKKTYRRVYSDWKPTIDKTDVVGVMEAIEDVEPATEKFAWRKSSLNVNSDEADVDARQLRRMRSRGSADASPSLEAIKEEDRKKAAEPTNVTPEKRFVSITGVNAEPVKCEEKTLPPFAPRRSFRRTDYEMPDKIEIDSDNVETPPPIRKMISKLRGKKGEEEESSSLGDGQFDRFSSARRTRRYRKDQTDGEGVPRPSTLEVKPQEAAESRLKQWQEKLMHKEEKPVPERQANSVSKTVIPILHSEPRGARHYSTLPRSYKTKGVTRVALNQNPKAEFIPEIKVRATTPRREESHDEGFEESQSLISDSPSSLVISEDARTFQRADSSGSGDTTASTSSASNKRLLKESSTFIPPKVKTTPTNVAGCSNFQRSGSLRGAKEPAVRKVETKRPMERYPSKSSLRSSRSSLNSCASASTVKAKPEAAKSCNKLTSPALVKKPLPVRKNGFAIRSELRGKMQPPLQSSFKENAAQKPPKGTSSFMRPTAASSAKDLNDKAKSRISFR